MAVHRRDPPYLGKYIINLKLTKYSQWKLSGWLLWDLGQLELTVSGGQFGRLCRHVYRKVSKQASMQVSGSSQDRTLIGLRICYGSW